MKLAKSDLATIGEHMARKPNIYRCAECLSSELPAIGRDRVEAVFSQLAKEDYRDPILWYETAICDQCGERGPAVIVH